MNVNVSSCGMLSKKEKCLDEQIFSQLSAMLPEVHVCKFANENFKYVLSF